MKLNVKQTLNIGIVKFQKQMEFNKDFYFNVFPKILSTVITIGLAFHFRSYMALVVGTLVATGIKVIASYLAISFRPKLSLKKAADIWSFSQWVLIRPVATRTVLFGSQRMGTHGPELHMTKQCSVVVAPS